MNRVEERRVDDLVVEGLSTDDRRPAVHRRHLTSSSSPKPSSGHGRR
jgi:hypothetical protein